MAAAAAALTLPATIVDALDPLMHGEGFGRDLVRVSAWTLGGGGKGEVSIGAQSVCQSGLRRAADLERVSAPRRERNRTEAAAVRRMTHKSCMRCASVDVCAQDVEEERGGVCKRWEGCIRRNKYPGLDIACTAVYAAP
ncbi:hypothetical protein BC628DRAFT_1367688 [Trametes gibbosa]|nr:hypothetical protein BC628DRAFT_1367688 [Trametes gibbosa]